LYIAAIAADQSWQHTQAQQLDDARRWGRIALTDGLRKLPRFKGLTSGSMPDTPEGRIPC
jgi:hypothetical protein